MKKHKVSRFMAVWTAIVLVLTACFTQSAFITLDAQADTATATSTFIIKTVNDDGKMSSHFEGKWYLDGTTETMYITGNAGSSNSGQHYQIQCSEVYGRNVVKMNDGTHTLKNAFNPFFGYQSASSVTFTLNEGVVSMRKQTDYAWLEDEHTLVLRQTKMERESISYYPGQPLSNLYTERTFEENEIASVEIQDDSMITWLYDLKTKKLQIIPKSNGSTRICVHLTSGESYLIETTIYYFMETTTSTTSATTTTTTSTTSTTTTTTMALALTGVKPSSATMTVGETLALEYSSNYSWRGLYYNDYSYISSVVDVKISDESVISLDNKGAVHALAPGKATITFWNRYGFGGYPDVSVSITVVPAETTAITTTKPTTTTTTTKTSITTTTTTTTMPSHVGRVEPTQVTLTVGETQQLTFYNLWGSTKHLPMYVTIHSNDEKIATVGEDGIIHAISEGSTTIIISNLYYSNPSYIYVPVTVKPAETTVTTPPIPKDISLSVGEQYQIEADKGMTYQSSDSTIVLVSKSGVITALSEGTAKVFVIDSDNEATVITVTVKKEFVKGDSNGDGVVSIADAVVLQKWILVLPNSKPNNWKSCDLNGDNKVNVYDLVLLKRVLLRK